ncbi:hypothetical protein [Salmon gill poxvirus]
METLVLWVTDIYDNLYLLDTSKNKYDMILIVVATNNPVSLRKYQLECFQLIIYSGNGNTYGINNDIRHTLFISGIYPDTDSLRNPVPPRNVFFDFDGLTDEVIEKLSIKYLLWGKNVSMNLLTFYFKLLYPENGTVFNSMLGDAINYKTLEKQLDVLNRVISSCNSGLERKIMAVNDDKSQAHFVIKLKTCEETKTILFRYVEYGSSESRNKLPPLVPLSVYDKAVPYISNWSEFMKMAAQRAENSGPMKPFIQSPLKQLCLFIRFCAKSSTVEDQYCHLPVTIENDVAMITCPYNVCPLGIEK